MATLELKPSSPFFFPFNEASFFHTFTAFPERVQSISGPRPWGGSWWEWDRSHSAVLCLPFPASSHISQENWYPQPLWATRHAIYTHHTFARVVIHKLYMHRLPYTFLSKSISSFIWKWRISINYSAKNNQIFKKQQEISEHVKTHSLLKHFILCDLYLFNIFTKKLHSTLQTLKNPVNKALK